MEKRQLIEEIRQLNTTATEQFLSQFDESDLAMYLEHLRTAKIRNIRQERTIRRREDRIAV